MLNDLRLLLLAAWLGAALFFSAAVAPAAFSVLRGFAVPNVSEIAGTIVTRTLSVINVGGFIIALFLMATALVYRRALAPRSFLVEIVLLIVLAVTTGAGHWIISARMRALRLAMMVPIDQVAIDDPRRKAFSLLHGYSVSALRIAMIAALVTFVLIAHRARFSAK